jgi:hypothetical protein
MRQRAIIIMSFVFFTIALNAKTKNISNRSFFSPIEFIEQGVHFTIFQNGTFDFRFAQYNNYNQHRYNGCITNRRISKDYHGYIRSIGSVTIDYDRYGRLSRIGNIDIRFRNRLVTSVGGLYIHYNNFGYVNYSGTVNRNVHHPKKHHYKVVPKHYKKNKVKLKSNRRYKKSRRA